MLAKIDFYNKMLQMNDYIWILYENISSDLKLLAKEQSDHLGDADIEIRIKRVLATNPVVIIPEQIEGEIVTTVGSYCFAENGHLSEEENKLIQEQLKQDFGLCEMCGNDIQKIILPDSVTTLESYAFYQCRELNELEVGTKLDVVHSDVFMNCRKLHHIFIRGRADEKTGLKFILSRLNLDVEVVFRGNDRNCICDEEDIDCDQEKIARLFYPEYIEGYEEIGPAHIFALNVEGEGYRARQCFKDNVIDIEKYDAIFEKSTNLENFDVLLQMALDRLMVPYGLSTSARIQYETYIEQNGHRILLYIIGKKDLEQLNYLGQVGVLRAADYKAAIQEAIAKNWTEGCALLIQYAGKRNLS